MLSFIIPAYNEEFELPATLASVHRAAQNTQHDYEIVVADDGSTDRTAEIATQRGARIVTINRRQIAASRNAGAHAAQGDILFFVDADTQINESQIVDAIAALNSGYVGGSARVRIQGFVPLWGRLFLRAFSTVYFGLNLGAGAFLFTTREAFDRVGGFDEDFFVGEEVYFSLALRKLGRFKILRTPILTSGRKLRMYSGLQFFRKILALAIRGRRAAQSRDGLDIWYDGRRETSNPS